MQYELRITAADVCLLTHLLGSRVSETEDTAHEILHSL